MTIGFPDRKIFFRKWEILLSFAFIRHVALGVFHLLQERLYNKKWASGCKGVKSDIYGISSILVGTDAMNNYCVVQILSVVNRTRK